MSTKRTVTAVSFLLGCGIGLHLYLQCNLESRSNQQRLMKHGDELFGKGRPEAEGPSKRALEDMLLGLKAKTTREKVEAAVDAAHRTHNIGFPSKNNAAHASKVYSKDL